jgi:CheY-like chemotaxis protein
LHDQHLIEGAPVSETASSAAKRSILVVDDNPDAAESLGELIRRWGYDVRIAFNGPEALEQLDNWCPHVALLDLGLPGMDGYGLAAAMREISRLDGCFLVALTGYGDKDDRIRTTQAGFNRHMLKPVDFDALKRILRGEVDS